MRRPRKPSGVGWDVAALVPVDIERARAAGGHGRRGEPLTADLLEAIHELGTTTWSGIAYRGVTLASADSPLSGQGTRRFGGRWNPPEHFPGVYLAHPRQACLAELRRTIDLATRPGRRRLFRIRVHDLQVLELTTEQRLAAVSL